MTELKRFTLNGPTMGTRYSAVFYAPISFDERDLALKLKAAIEAVDQQMSTWKPESDLNRINNTPPGNWIDIPRQLMTVLETALAIEQRSGGSFNIGIGHHVARWGFGAHAGQLSNTSVATQRVPCPTTRTALLLDPPNGRVQRRADLSLDLSGIAKGFGVDELAREMSACGIQDWLVGIDGEMRARGRKPDGTAWAIGHERPIAGRREVMGVIELTDRAVATSGNYRHFRDEGGRRISHTIDPRDGHPVTNTIAATTILAQSCMEADAWATAFLVMGENHALETARKNGLDVIIVRFDESIVSTI